MVSSTNWNHGSRGKECTSHVDRIYHTVTRKKFPVLGGIVDRFEILPLYVRICCVMIGALWKFYMLYLSVRFISEYESSITSSSTLLNDLSVENATVGGEAANQTVSQDGESSSYLYQQAPPEPPVILTETIDSNVDEDPPFRVLHILTSLAEYQNGRRDTVKGVDRLQETMIPNLVSSVTTMISPPYDYHVDVYLILAYKLKPERRLLIEKALPEGVGLDVWDDAMPMGYNMPEHDGISEIDRSLARQVCWSYCVVLCFYVYT